MLNTAYININRFASIINYEAFNIPEMKSKGLKITEHTNRNKIRILSHQNKVYF